MPASESLITRLEELPTNLPALSAVALDSCERPWKAFDYGITFAIQNGGSRFHTVHAVQVPIHPAAGDMGRAAGSYDGEGQHGDVILDAAEKKGADPILLDSTGKRRHGTCKGPILGLGL